MIRTLIFMGLMAMSMSKAPSCMPPAPVHPLYQTALETLELTKKEVTSSIILTNEKVKRNEVELHVGNEIIDSLTEAIKQIDTLIATAVQLGYSGTKEEIMLFARRTNEFTSSTLTNLKSLGDLYDISTYSQFESATFFSADSFSIPAEKMDEAKKAIEPVAQRIIRFFSDHPREKFKVVIICSSAFDGQEQNVKLGELRARSVANLLSNQMRSKEEFIPTPERIRIKWMAQKAAIGKGRSMVSIIWNLLPASLYAGASDH
jgi:outer membrane protein OmpA-like peptidoglycan-associated protein